MTEEQIITKFYGKAVEGLKEEWLISTSTQWYEYIISLPEKEKITYMICIMHDQIFNGGFDQYFVNAYGRFAFETISALNKIGATQRAALLSQAVKIVNDENYSPEVFREKVVAKKLSSLFNSEIVSLQLDALDDKYYDLEDEDIHDLLTTFLAKD